MSKNQTREDSSNSTVKCKLMRSKPVKHDNELSMVELLQTEKEWINHQEEPEKEEPVISIENVISRIVDVCDMLRDLKHDLKIIKRRNKW